jgi:hypothetical protein
VSSTTATTSRRDVAVVPWPIERALRQQLADLGVPRVLLIPEGVEPPAPLDELEDWVREGIHPSDLAARARSLSYRAVGDRPSVDDDGLLHHAGRWTSVPVSQIEVVRLIVDRLDRVVSKEAITETYVAAGGSGHPNSIRTLLTRLANRMASMGLDLVTIRGRGVLLTVPRTQGGDP